MLLCCGAAWLSLFCCHTGEVGQSMQPGMFPGAGLCHSPAVPLMEKPYSHCDPGTKGPSALLEVPATTVLRYTAP